jgi:tetratricopeptide (TPR) repeat protein
MRVAACTLVALLLLGLSGVRSGAQSQAAPANAAASPLDAAEAAIEQREYAKARQLVMQALSDHPQDTRALYDLGFLEYATDHNSEAEQDYRRVIELAPALPQAHLALGRLLLHTDRADEARQQFTLVAQDTKVDSALRGEAWRELAKLDLKDNPTQSRQDLLHALEVSSESPEDTYMTGQLGEALGDMDTAEQAYRKLLRQNELAEQATVAIGRILLKQKRYPDVLTLLQPAHTSYPQNALITAQLASALANTGKQTEALPLLEQAHEADPVTPAITRMLADVANESGRPDEAEGLYVSLLKNEPKDPQLLAAYGASLIRQQRYFEAVPPLQQAVALKPDLGDAWGSLAFADSRLQKYDEVLKDLTQRKKYLPDNASTYFLWGSSYDKLRHIKEAEQYYRLFLDAAGGKFPDQEFQVRHRLAAMEHK